MAAKADVETDIIVLPHHVSVTLRDRRSGDVTEQGRSITSGPVSFDINTRLSNLSWKVAEGKVSLEDAPRVMLHALHTQHLNQWVVMMLVVVANASFCRLFGGDAVSMAIVAFATFVGYSLKILMLDAGLDIRLMMLCCAFVSSVIGASAFSIPWTSTPDVALGTSVLYLIPGIPYINSVSDMLDGHYLCAVSRFLNAVILTACIALGMTAGFLIMDIKIF